MLHRGSNCSLARAMDGRIMRCGIINSCQSAATSEKVLLGMTCVICKQRWRTSCRDSDEVTFAVLWYVTPERFVDVRGCGTYMAWRVSSTLASGTEMCRFSVPLLMTWCHQTNLPKSKLNTDLYIFCCTMVAKNAPIAQNCTYIFKNCPEVTPPDPHNS